MKRGILGRHRVDFQARTTRNIIDLRVASADDPTAREADEVGHAHLLGTYHYYAAERYGPDRTRMVCFPDTLPASATVSMFVEWAKELPSAHNRPAGGSEASG